MTRQVGSGLRPRRWVCALTVVALALARLASARHLPLQRLDAASGLAADSVTTLLADSRGYLWVGSHEALSRYDGQAFTRYGTEDGLPSNTIHALAEDGTGAIWIGTSAGLARIDASSVRGAHLAEPPPCRALQGQPVVALAAGPGSTLWAASDHRVVEMTSGGRCLDVTPPAVARPPSEVTSLAVDRAGALWVGTSAGLVPPGRDLVALPVEPGAAAALQLVFGSRGELWVLHDRGVLQAREVEDGRLVFEPFRAPPDPAGDRRWRGLAVSADGGLWAATSVGLVVLGRDAAATLSAADGLVQGELSAVSEDRWGNLWIGTQSHGVQRLARSGVESFGLEDGLADTRIVQLSTGPDGHLLVLVRHAGRLVLHRLSGGRFVPLELRLPGPREPGGWGWKQLLVRSWDETWWLGTGHGLGRFSSSPQTGLPSPGPGARLVRLTERAEGDDVFRVYEDSRKNLWIGTFGEETLLVKDALTGVIRRYGAREGLPHAAPSAFAEDGQGALWAGLYSGGVVRVRGEQVDYFGPAIGGPVGFVHDILRDRRGRLWIACSGSGVLRVDAPDATPPVFQPVPGLRGVPRCLAEGPGGEIWIGSSQGAERLSPLTGAVQRLTTTDGLANNILSAIHVDPEGAVWLGTLDGLTRVAPGARRAARLPTVVVCGLRVSGQPRPVPELGAASVEGIVLEPGQSNLWVEYRGLSLEPGRRLRFEYRLGTPEARWHATPGDGHLLLAGLAPGAYQLAIRAGYESDSRWSEPALVEIVVLSPLWRRWWFFLAVLGVMLALGYASHRWRLGKRLAVERVRARIASDLHDDLGASLTRISVLAEVASRSLPKEAQALGILGTIGETSRSLIDALSDSIWAVDPRRDTLASLLARLQQHAAELTDGRGPAWHLEVPVGAERIHLAPEPRRHLYLLLKEALTNAIKHAAASRLELVARLDGRRLQVELRDDGRGFDTSATDSSPRLRGGNGLGNMAARAAALHARLGVESAPGKGTAVVLEVQL